MIVGRICRRDVGTAAVGDTVKDAADRMAARSVGTLVVADDENRVVGIVTDRDLVVRVLARGLDPRTTLLRSVMSVDPKCAPEDLPGEMAVAMMVEGPYRRLPVVDEERKLRGIIALDDVLAAMAADFHRVWKLLRRETPR